ncbi:hypothetical protein KJ966_04090 [bacterium]|nr:hypothetical protein [bacterium]
MSTINTLIQSVTGIILKHAKPERIYLYGSYAEKENEIPFELLIRRFEIAQSQKL